MYFSEVFLGFVMGAEKDFWVNTQNFEKKYGNDDRQKKFYAGVMVLSTAAIFGCVYLGYRLPHSLAIFLAILFWVFALVFYIIGKKTKIASALNPLLNSAAAGFAISAFFSHQNLIPSSRLLGVFGSCFLAINIAA